MKVFLLYTFFFSSSTFCSSVYSGPFCGLYYLLSKFSNHHVCRNNALFLTENARQVYKELFFLVLTKILFCPHYFKYVHFEPLPHMSNCKIVLNHQPFTKIHLNGDWYANMKDNDDSTIHLKVKVKKGMVVNKTNKYTLFLAEPTETTVKPGFIRTLLLRLFNLAPQQLMAMETLVLTEFVAPRAWVDVADAKQDLKCAVPQFNQSPICSTDNLFSPKRQSEGKQSRAQLELNSLMDIFYSLLSVVLKASLLTSESDFNFVTAFMGLHSNYYHLASTKTQKYKHHGHTMKTGNESTFPRPFIIDFNDCDKYMMYVCGLKANKMILSNQQICVGVDSLNSVLENQLVIWNRSISGNVNPDDLISYIVWLNPHISKVLLTNVEKADQMLEHKTKSSKANLAETLTRKQMRLTEKSYELKPVNLKKFDIEHPVMLTILINNDLATIKSLVEHYKRMIEILRFSYDLGLHSKLRIHLDNTQKVYYDCIDQSLHPVNTNTVFRIISASAFSNPKENTKVSKRASKKAPYRSSSTLLPWKALSDS